MALLKSVEDYGFLNPSEYVIETFEVWYLTNYQQLPEAGGWNNQDKAWQQDMRRMLRIVSANRYALKQGQALKVTTVNKDQQPSWADAL